MGFRSVITFIVLTFALHSCMDDDGGKIHQAYGLLSEHPDSAYIILNDIDYEGLSSDADRAGYILLKAESKKAMGRSLISDTLLHYAVAYYRDRSDTLSYMRASFAFSGHLHSLDRGKDAYAVLDSAYSYVFGDTSLMMAVNQERLGLSFKYKDYVRSLDLVQSQLGLTDDAHWRIDFEIKKISPLISLGRTKEAICLCDSLFALSGAAGMDKGQEMTLRINYAAVLAEDPESSQKAVRILEGVLEEYGDANNAKFELYIPMVHLYLNAGDVESAKKYIAIVDSVGFGQGRADIVASSYFEFLKLIKDYRTSGNLSMSRLTGIAKALRSADDNALRRMQERNDALETAYGLSRNNYELTIRHERLLIIFFVIFLVAIFGIGVFYYISYKRRKRLIEAEERIETLQTLVKSAANPATERKLGLLQKLLLQQLGIIKTFAGSPSTQNQEALRKISNIGNTDVMADTLVKWEDLYPVINELYGNFHANIVGAYNGLFSDREIHILCLMRAGFSTKEISVLLQQTSNSVYVSKTSIRKKLALPPKDDFILFLTKRFEA